VSLFSILGSTANTLNVFQKALNVSQNNIANASTPGYASQTATFNALPFDQTTNLGGGVMSGPTLSTRNEFSERNVRDQNSQLGLAEQQVESLTDLQSYFDISGNSGIPAAFTALSNAFSNWSLNTNDATAQQNVIQSAQSLASAFQTTAANITAAAGTNQKQLSSIVSQVNSYTAAIAADNAKIQSGGRGDPSVSADLNNNLEKLSEIAGISTITQADGTVTVQLGGQFTLVAGSQQYAISSTISVPTSPTPTYSPAPPNAQVLDAQGNDITSTITSGKLGGILTVLNQTIPSITGDSTHQGSLNILAQTFADAVNNTLTAGNVTDGPPVVKGSPLFSYDTTNPTNVAASLALDPNASGATLAAIAPANPNSVPPTTEVSNGNALKLAGLASASNQINGQSFTQYFGSIAANVGSALSSATTNQTLQTNLVAQARSLRDQQSGVDLNKEAVNVVELQTAYQAAAKMMSVVDTLTQDVLGIIK
jgi:flagellar hook-associated protein 1 FlgK